MRLFPGQAAAALACTLAAIVPAAAKTAAPVVQTDAGAVRGINSGRVAIWKGIPFAAPPVGPNRWREPQPTPGWQGIRNATTYGHDCMQKPFPSDAAPLGTEPAEDCLVLNVWRPAAARPGAKLPVMVWIYGGGFVNGGASPAVYSGDKFARDGIVFVSFNYRLGRFGFFAHPALTAAHEGMLGNYGHMDQIAALQWVRRNIAAFGGNPHNVTVVGESAGGNSTLMVLTSPLARGLFNRVAVMSGGGRGRPMPTRKISEDQPGVVSGETIGLNFARGVGIEGVGPDSLARLRALSAQQVVQGLNMSSSRSPEAAQTYVGGPMFDGRTVIGMPDIAIASGKAAPVPVMIGSTSADAGFPTARDKDELFAEFGAGAAAARALYDPDGTAEFPALARAVAGDKGMTEPARHIAELVAANGQASWYYRFGYVADSLRETWRAGAPHATDIPWAFETADVKYGDKLSARDAQAARTWHKYFVNYARSGNPNGAGLANWKPYADGGSILLITPDGTAQGGADPLKQRLDLFTAVAAGR